MVVQSGNMIGIFGCLSMSPVPFGMQSTHARTRLYKMPCYHKEDHVNFDTYQILQQHRVASLPRHGFLVGLFLQTTVNYLSKSEKY